jgi:transposase
LLDWVPPVRGRIGRPRRRPRTLIADRGYDYDEYQRLVWQRGIKPIIARRQTKHGSGLGRHRWVVERTFAWLHNRRRLLIRTDRRDDNPLGLPRPRLLPRLLAAAGELNP